MCDTGAQIINLANIRRQQKWKWLDDAREICSAMDGFSYTQAMMTLFDRVQRMHDASVRVGEMVDVREADVNDFIMNHIFNTYGVPRKDQEFFLVSMFNAQNSEAGYRMEM